MRVEGHSSCSAIASSLSASAARVSMSTSVQDMIEAIEAARDQKEKGTSALNFSSVLVAFSRYLCYLLKFSYGLPQVF